MNGYRLPISIVAALFLALFLAALPKTAQSRAEKGIGPRLDSLDSQMVSVPRARQNQNTAQGAPSNYFEDFEGADFVCGAQVIGQGAGNGPLYTWAARYSQDPAFGPASITEGHVECVAPSFSGGKHVRLSKDVARTTSAFGCVIDARVPDNAVAEANTPPIGPTTVSVEVAISGPGGSNFNVQPQARWQGFSTARVLFSYYGNTYILDNPGGGLTFVPAGPWDTTGGYQHLDINITPCDPFRCTGGVADGVPCTTDADCVGDGGGGIPDGVCASRIHYDYGNGAWTYDGITYGGINVDQLQFYSDNFGEHMDIDDVAITRDDQCPAPPTQLLEPPCKPCKDGLKTSPCNCEGGRYCGAPVSA